MWPVVADGAESVRVPVPHSRHRRSDTGHRRRAHHPLDRGGDVRVPGLRGGAGAGSAGDRRTVRRRSRRQSHPHRRTGRSRRIQDSRRVRRIVGARPMRIGRGALTAKPGVADAETDRVDPGCLALAGVDHVRRQPLPAPLSGGRIDSGRFPRGQCPTIRVAVVDVQRGFPECVFGSTTGRIRPIALIHLVTTRYPAPLPRCPTHGHG